MTDWTQHQHFSKLWSALITAHHIRHHSIRTPTVCTIGPNHPKPRTMVLREFGSDKSPTLILFTDIRSPKCQEIQANNAVTLHVYDAENQQQIQFFTQGTIHQTHPKMSEWIHCALRRPMDYATVLAPSTRINCADHSLDNTLASEHFAVIICAVQTIEILKIGTPHARCRWTNQNGRWTQTWLVP